MYIIKKSDIEQFKWPYPAMIYYILHTVYIYIYLFIICIKYKQAKCNTYNKCSNLFLNDLSGLFSHDSTRGTEELDCQWRR